jgi:hypothetical protein
MSVVALIAKISLYIEKPVTQLNVLHVRVDLFKSIQISVAIAINFISLEKII